MNEYHPLDLEHERAELESARHITNADKARQKIAAVQTSALLDIAGSLQVLAAEVLTTYGAALGVGTTSDRDEADVADSERDFLLVGDLVHLRDDAEPGEVVKVGVDQGEAYADVLWPGRASADRLYQSYLVRIVDGPSSETIERIAEAITASIVSDDQGGEPVEIIGEPIVPAQTEPPLPVGDDGIPVATAIEDDFDEPRTDGALAELERRDAEKRAAKKKGSKK